MRSNDPLFLFGRLLLAEVEAEARLRWVCSELDASSAAAGAAGSGVADATAGGGVGGGAGAVLAACGGLRVSGSAGTPLSGAAAASAGCSAGGSELLSSEGVKAAS